MAHEIESTDKVTLYQTPAWHGLGEIVEDLMTPMEAFERTIPWRVTGTPMYIKDDDGTLIRVPTHVANLRSDIPKSDPDSLLAIVGAGYIPVQNEEMALFCEALRDEGDVKVETVGSIRGGKRVWMLLRGEEFEVANGDGIFPYCLVSNGHDGLFSFRVTPTTVRVVCSNTLHAVTPQGDGSLRMSAIKLNHTMNVMERVEDAKAALKEYDVAVAGIRQVADVLTQRPVKKKDLEDFFTECYQRDFGAIPKNPTTKKEENARERAKSAFASFTRRFDDEASITGASMWGAFNAYSGMIQHDKKARGKDDIKRVEKRVESNLFGLNQTRTQNALLYAFRAV